MPVSISRLLCCLGLKDDCRQVLAPTLTLAKATGADVHVLQAVKALSDDVRHTLKANIGERATLDGLMEQRLRLARERLDEFVEAFWQEHEANLPGREVVAAKSVLEGYPASEITRYAVRHDCDMIIMATNKRGFASSYAGRVTKGVIKRASVPVVVVPPM